MNRALLAGVFLSCASHAFALNPSLDSSQYSHTAWRIRDGFVKGIINAIAQTPDGYIWLGTDAGALRFDGVRTVPWHLLSDQHLPSERVTALATASDGTLWIGTSQGLASWRNRALTHYRDLDGALIARLVEDRQHSVWATTYRIVTNRWSLCAVQRGRVECHGDDGGPGAGAIGLQTDSRGRLWVGTSTGLWRWKPGPPEFFPLTPEAWSGLLSSAFAEGEDGSLLISMPGGIHRLVDRTTQVLYPFPASISGLAPRRLLRDRDGGLWMGRASSLVHVHEGTTDVFSEADGLSGNDVHALFEDRESNIWVSTNNGLDRFRNPVAGVFSARQGLSESQIQALLGSADGSIWVSTFAAVNRLQANRVTVYRDRIAKSDSSVKPPNTPRERREVVLSGFGGEPGTPVTAMFEDHMGRMWISMPTGVGHLANDRFVPLPGIPGGLTRSIVEDNRNLWVLKTSGLFRVPHDGSEIEETPWPLLNHQDEATAAAADPQQSGIWLGFGAGGVSYFADGVIRAAYGKSDGLGTGAVRHLRLDPDGTVWAATESGLSRIKGRVTTLTSGNGLPCDGIEWSIEDDARSLWVCTRCGLARIEDAEVNAWAAAVDHDQRARPTVRTTVFDSTDGVRAFVGAFYYNSPVVKAADGRLWFKSLEGAGIIDPRHISYNDVPPPVHIERIAADRTTYDAESVADGRVQLPPLVRDLQIDYTALSLVAPEKIQFRYKLENFDADWQDPGSRRQAFYTNLSPGTYRFRVKAANNSGVWNETGAALDFSIAPAYYQTIWFRSLAVFAFAALLWAAYRHRLRQVAYEFDARLQERVHERTRIARELHDTLLQSFQGLMLRLQVVDDLLPEGKAKHQLEQALERGDQAIAEGRSAVYDLRRSATATNDLAEAVRALGEEMATPDSAAFHFVVEGTPRDLNPILRDEVYRITREALRNAFSHARARHVEIEIEYGERAFRVRIRDDGDGIRPETLEEGRTGHYGLQGMRERARQVAGNLDIWSRPGAGTEIDLTIAGSIAYGTASNRPLRRLFRTRAG